MKRPRRATARVARAFALAAAVVFVVVLGAALAARPAEAYVRYRTADGAPFAWKGQSCVPVTAYPEGARGMTPAQVMHAASAAAAAWSADQNSCSFLRIDVQSATDQAPPVSYDGRNMLVFRQESWCRPTAEPAGTCGYDPAALAITSLFAKADGKIVDGDIEVNARYFAWTDLDLLASDPGTQDLQNALTHEMGHLIGLDHPCYLPPSVAARPNDDLGNPVPDCSDASEAIQETTMFPSASAGDVSKRTLAPDEQRAVCEIYPVERDPMLCPPPAPPPADDPSGCSLAGAARGTAVLAPLAWPAGALLWAARRRRRRRGC